MHINIFLTPVTPPERSGRFAKQEDKCLSEASLSSRKTSAERKPEGQGAGRPFTLFGRTKKVKRRLEAKP